MRDILEYLEELLMPKKNFERLLLEAVDEGLSSLGESSKEAIYFHLRRSFNIKKREIPYKIEAFAYAIEKIFGLGASFLETLILKRLNEKVGGGFRWHRAESLTFAERVALARRSFREKERVKKGAEELTLLEETIIEV